VKFYNPGSLDSVVKYSDEWKKIKGQQGAVKRNGKNHPVQGTAADIAKLAISRVNRRLESIPNTYICHFVHDEIQVETDASNAEEVKVAMNEEMVKASDEIIPSVKMKVDVGITTSWAGK
jgi:DNA polymerase-1